MSMTDPIADLLTRLRNGTRASRKKIDIPASNFKRELANKLENLQFVKKVVDIKDNKQGILRIYLRYTKLDEPIIRGIKRVSRPGLRVYVDTDKLVRMRNQMGTTIISTSRGLKTDDECRVEGIGGEAVCYVW